MSELFNEESELNQNDTENNFNTQNLEELEDQKEQTNKINKLHKLSKSELIGKLLDTESKIERMESDLKNLEADNSKVNHNFNELLKKVAKWENDKNTLMKFMQKENEDTQRELINGVIEVIDIMQSFEKVPDQNINIQATNSIQSLMNKFKLKVIQTDTFDPQLHIATAKTEHGKNIIQCIKKGYMYKEKVMRYAIILLD